MIRRGLTFLIVAGLCLLVSCKPEKRPEGVLSKEEFAAFLIDTYLAEAKLNALALSRDSALKLYLPYEEELLKKKGLTDSVVKITYQYYLDHPKEMEEVYAAVTDTLNLREQRFHMEPN